MGVDDGIKNVLPIPYTFITIIVILDGCSDLIIKDPLQQCVLLICLMHTSTCIYYRCIIANAIYMYMLSVSIAVKTIILWFCNFAVFAYAVCFAD